MIRPNVGHGLIRWKERKKSQVEKSHSRRVIEADKHVICIKKGDYSINQVKVINSCLLKKLNFILRSGRNGWLFTCINSFDKNKISKYLIFERKNRKKNEIKEKIKCISICMYTCRQVIYSAIWINYVHVYLFLICGLLNAKRDLWYKQNSQPYNEASLRLIVDSPAFHEIDYQVDY